MESDPVNNVEVLPEQTHLKEPTPADTKCVRNTNRVCRFFNSKGGCRAGVDCRFKHIVFEKKPKKKPTEKAFSTTVIHHQHRPPADRPEIKLSLGKEFDQLAQRYQDDFKRLGNQQNKCGIYIRPTDPEWQSKGIPIDQVYAEFEFTAQYPDNPPQITISDEDVPEVIAKRIQKAIISKASELSGRFQMRTLINWTANNLADIIIDKLAVQRAVCGITLVRPKHSQNHCPTIENQGSESAILEQLSLTSDDNLLEDVLRNPSNEESQQPVTSFQTSSQQVSAGGLDIICEGLVLGESVSLLRCRILDITCICKRCKEPADFSIKSDEEISQPCSRCGRSLTLYFISELIHTTVNRLGSIDLKGMIPRDVKGGHFDVTCFECSKIKRISNIAPGRKVSFACQKCHAKMWFIPYDSIMFLRVKPVSSKSVLKAHIYSEEKNQRESERALGLIRGKPLPETGTCKHYSRSHRWMRFPCCGKLFPCDVCHDSQSDHPMERATRMVCGFCACEQPFSSKPCSSCGKDLAGSRPATRFWEGGKGCRDSSKLDRHDSHRYRGQMKTSSRKQERVGEKKK